MNSTQNAQTAYEAAAAAYHTAESAYSAATFARWENPSAENDEAAKVAYKAMCDADAAASARFNDAASAQ